MTLNGVPPICTNDGCLRRTRTFKKDPTKYTKHCDTCSGIKTMEIMIKKSAEEVKLGVPICQHGVCLLPARLWKGATNKYAKFCNGCSAIRREHWTSYKAYLEDRMIKPSS